MAVVRPTTLVPGPQGPQGSAGPQGPQGTTGATGAAGPDNVIVGKTVPALGAAQDGFGWTYNHAAGAMVWTRQASKAELDAGLANNAFPWPRLKTGRWYSNSIDTGGAVSNGPGIIVYHPWLFPRGGTFDRITLEVITAVAASNVRIGVYSDDGTGNPSALIQEFGSIDSTTVGTKILTINWSTTPGSLYHVATLPQGGTPGIRGGTRGWFQVPTFGATPPAGTAFAQYNNAGGQNGALPNVPPAPNVALQFPHSMWLRSA